MLAVSCCQRSLAHTIHRPVSMRNRKSQPKSPVTRWDMPNGVQWRLCWAANSSGSGAGSGEASETPRLVSSSGRLRLLLFQCWAVLFGATCRGGAHGSNAGTPPRPRQPHEGRLTEQPVHAVKIMAEPEHQFAVEVEVQPGAVAGRYRAVEELAEVLPIRGGPGEVEQLRVGERRCGCGGSRWQRRRRLCHTKHFLVQRQQFGGAVLQVHRSPGQVLTGHDGAARPGIDFDVASAASSFWRLIRADEDMEAAARRRDFGIAVHLRDDGECPGLDLAGQRVTTVVKIDEAKRCGFVVVEPEDEAVITGAFGGRVRKELGHELIAGTGVGAVSRPQRMRVDGDLAAVRN